MLRPEFEGQPFLVALVGADSTVGTLADKLRVEGAEPEIFTTVDALWEALSDAPNLDAIFVVGSAAEASRLRSRLHARWQDESPSVVLVGGSEPALNIDAALPDVEDRIAIRSMCGLFRRIHQARTRLMALEGVQVGLSEAVDHDLRNPLIVMEHLLISVSGEMLSAKGRMDVQGALQTVRTARRRLQGLELPRAHQAHPIQMTSFSVRSVFGEVLQSTGFSGRIVEWVPEVDDPIIEADVELFRRTFEHLLTNVRVHTGGWAAVRIQTERDTVIIEIGDHGAGLRAIQPETDGQGLIFCKQAVTAHKGELTLHNRPGGGLMVRTSWPCLVETRRVGVPQVESTAESPALVWFADDEALVRKAVTRLLRRSGYRVDTFESGDKMLEALEESAEKPEVIICDADMPGTQGLDVLRKVHSILPRAARVLYTAYQPTAMVVEAFNQGTVHRFINKGRGAAQIESCVKSLTASRRAARTEGQRRDEMRTALEDLLSRGACTLHLQPLFDAKTREMVACEALLRSEHPRFRGPLDILEATRAYARELPLQRLLSTIGRTIRETLPNDIALLINIDPIILASTDNLDVAFSPLYPVANNIVLELTERAQLGHDGTWEKAVKRLRQSGFRIALDDVGAGYNSLGAVIAVSPDIMKLDIALISNLHRDPQKAELVRLLCNYAKQQNILIVAEGIEAEGEARRCRELGVDWLQGFHLARPMPMERVLEQFLDQTG